MANTYINITKQVLTTASTSVTFSSIPQTYDDIIIRVSAHSTDSVNNVDNLLIRFNSDSGGNYSSLEFLGRNVSTGPEGIRTIATTGMPNIQLPTNTINASYFNSAELYIPKYTVTSPKQIKVWNFCPNPTNTANATRVAGMGQYYNTSSAISSISFASANGYNLAAGSGFWLYGIKNT